MVRISQSLEVRNFPIPQHMGAGAAKCGAGGGSHPSGRQAMLNAQVRQDDSVAISS